MTGGRIGARALAAALLASVTIGCGDDEQTQTTQGNQGAASTPAGAADRQRADGEGLAAFIVDSFNERMLRCDYKGTLAALREEARLFEPSARSSLYGEYPPEAYTGPPDPIDSSVHSRENPPPTRAQELANAEALFPGGRLVDGLDSPDDSVEPPADFPFHFNDSDLDDIDLQTLAGAPYSAVCRGAIAHLASGKPGRLRASYKRDGNDADGNPQWALSFPVGGDETGDLRVVPARRLVAKKGPQGWSIVQFVPVDYYEG